MNITCNTCCHVDHNPWRVYDGRGRVINGCVDVCHTGRLVTPSASASWHGRKEARQIRVALRRMLQSR